MTKPKNVCGYCGAVAPGSESRGLYEWMEFHLPCWEPMHRKCTDECEEAASVYLRGRAYEIVGRLSARWSAERGD